MQDFIPLRLQKVRKILKDKNLDSLLVSNVANITYLSDFSFGISEDRDGFIFITSKNQYFISSFLYKEEILKKTKDFKFLELSSATNQTLSGYLKEILKLENIKNVAIESEDLTVNEYVFLKKLDIRIIPSNLSEVRMIKDPEEILRIKKACQITDETFKFILTKIKIGVTEKQIANLLENFIKEKNVTLSFPTIVAFGPNAAVPHHNTSDQKLKKNNFVLLDFGVRYENYCSDMTRTIYFGNPTEKEKFYYNAVKMAQDKSLEYLNQTKNNKLASEIDQTARRYLESINLSSFQHSSHGIGIKIHERPSLRPSSKDIIKENMIFSVEPGFYMERKLGIRIEDDVLATKSGCEVLTKSPKELIIL